MSLGIFRPLCLRGDWRNPLSAKMTCHLASTSIAKGSTLCEIVSVTWIYPGQHHSSQREKVASPGRKSSRGLLCSREILQTRDEMSKFAFVGEKKQAKIGQD